MPLGRPLGWLIALVLVVGGVLVAGLAFQDVWGWVGPVPAGIVAVPVLSVGARRYELRCAPSSGGAHEGLAAFGPGRTLAPTAAFARHGDVRSWLLLARALLNSPRVLFLDEPTRGLDPRSARELHETVTALAAEGTTVFLTTHNMNEADELCQRVAFLAEGRLVALDTPRALKLSLANQAPEVEVVLDDGTQVRLKLDQPPDAASLQELIAAGRIRSMHSLGPTLADVFIHLAGRSLEDDRSEETEEW